MALGTRGEDGEDVCLAVLAGERGACILLCSQTSESARRMVPDMRWKPAELMQKPNTLPLSQAVPVEHLAAGFYSVTNSYKFYWLLAILAQVRERRGPVLAIDALMTQMVAAAWYPSSYFRLSFGKQDQLGLLALTLQAALNLPAHSPKAEIAAACLRYAEENAAFAKTLRSLAKYVPYRFLRPNFAAETRGLADWKVNEAIRQLAAQHFTDAASPCLYRFVEDGTERIELHPQWVDYLERNLAIVDGFCRWHLTNYLQRNNPNTPNIASKLAEPEERNLRRARLFWQAAQATLGPLRCIYSGETLVDSTSLDHFLPWRFVAHDLLWNITPTSRPVNSAKNDQLPDFACYFEPFAALQFDAVQAVASQGKAALLEDHILLLKMASLAAVQALPYAAFRRTLEETLAPQMQIARSMGFVDGWRYAPP